MTEVLAGASAALLAVGLVVLVVGLLRMERADRLERPSSLDRARRWWNRAPLRTRAHWIGAFVVGFVAWVATGWVIALLVVPALVLGLPALLGEPVNRELVLLEALDRWVRGLAGSLPTGKSIPDAIRVTLPQAPSEIASDVRLLVFRLDDRWTIDSALRAFADGLDAPEADAVVAALILCASHGGTGAAATLHELAEGIHERLRALREIEAERAKPRVVVRQVTVISIVVLAVATLVSPEFFVPYAHAVGQVFLGGLLAAFVLPLVVLRRMTLPRRRDRILRRFEHVDTDPAADFESEPKGVTVRA